MAKAVEAHKLLDPHQIDLLDATRGYLATQKQRSASIPLRELCTLYIESKRDRDERHLKGMRQAMNRFSTLHDRLVTDISHRDLEPLLNEIVPGGRNLEQILIK